MNRCALGLHTWTLYWDAIEEDAGKLCDLSYRTCARCNRTEICNVWWEPVAPARRVQLIFAPRTQGEVK